MPDRLPDEALEALYYRYKDMVYRIVRLRMRQESDAEDVFQEIFVRLSRHASSLRDDEHTKAWLIRVTLNCCNSFYRSSWFRRIAAFNENVADNDDSDVPDCEARERGYAGAETGYSDVPPESDRDEAVYAAVHSLPAKERDAIHLFYYEEMSIREIARTIGDSEGAVKTRLSRARKRLENLLRGMKI